MREFLSGGYLRTGRPYLRAQQIFAVAQPSYVLFALLRGRCSRCSHCLLFREVSVYTCVREPAGFALGAPVVADHS